MKWGLSLEVRIIIFEKCSDNMSDQQLGWPAIKENQSDKCFVANYSSRTMWEV